MRKSVITFLLISACNPDPGTTSIESNTTTGPHVTSIGATTEAGSTTDATETATPTTGDPTTSTTSTTSTTTTGAPVGGPCDGVPTNDECPCVGASDQFCADLDAFCRTVVGLDLSVKNPPGTDYCDVLGTYCATPGTSNYGACELIESTCEQVAPSGDVNDCAGVRDACACNDFVIDDGDTSTGDTVDATTGETGEDVAPDAPASGSPLGKCAEGDTCGGVGPSGAPNVCRKADLFNGNICLAACSDNDDCDLNSECLDIDGFGLVCAWPCFDANDCPFANMACAPNPLPSTCMWQD